MAIQDPVVAEVRETRERLLAEAGGFDEYVRKLKQRETEDALRLVTKVFPHTSLPAAHCAEEQAEYKGNQ